MLRCKAWRLFVTEAQLSPSWLKQSTWKNVRLHLPLVCARAESPQPWRGLIWLILLSTTIKSKVYDKCLTYATSLWWHDYVTVCSKWVKPEWKCINCQKNPNLYEPNLGNHNSWHTKHFVQKQKQNIGLFMEFTATSSNSLQKLRKENFEFISCSG
jgi:hypothetical protein